MLRCDANHAPALVKAALPGFPNARVSLTLIDPCSASFSWHSLAALTLHERMDLMILFPEDMDIERNLAHEARLDAYFGCPTWRDAMQGHGNRGSALREFYKKRVAEELEFQFGDDKAVRASNGTEIYKFLFASKHRLGVKLWNETTRTTPDGQLALRLDC